jgi:hypothetical protein
MGGTPVKDVEVEAAKKRQAQSCELALEVRKLIGDESTSPIPSARPDASAVPGASASASPDASGAPSASAAPKTPAP